MVAGGGPFDDVRPRQVVADASVASGEDRQPEPDRQQERERVDQQSGSPDQRAEEPWWAPVRTDDPDPEDRLPERAPGNDVGHDDQHQDQHDQGDGEPDARMAAIGGCQLVSTAISAPTPQGPTSEALQGIQDAFNNTPGPVYPGAAPLLRSLLDASTPAAKAQAVQKLQGWCMRNGLAAQP